MEKKYFEDNLETKLKNEIDTIAVNREIKDKIIEKINNCESEKKSSGKKIKIYFSRTVAAVLLFCIMSGAANVVSYAITGQTVFSYIKENIRQNSKSTKNMFDVDTSENTSNEVFDKYVISANETICVDGCEITFIDYVYDDVLDNLRLVLRINDGDITNNEEQDYDSTKKNGQEETIDESQNEKIFEVRYSGNKMLYGYIERKEDELKEYYLKQGKSGEFEGLIEYIMEKEYLEDGIYLSIVIERPYITDNHKINFNLARNEDGKNIFLAGYSLDMSKTKSVKSRNFEGNGGKATLTVFGLKIEKSLDDYEEIYLGEEVFFEMADGSRIKAESGLSNVSYDSIRKKGEINMAFGYKDAINPDEIEKIIVGDSVLTKLNNKSKNRQ